MEKVEFILGPSKSLTIYLGLIFLGTAAVIVYLPLLYIFKIMGIALLFLYSRRIWDLHGRRNTKKSIIRIWQDPQGRWGCETQEGHAAIGKLNTDSFISLWFMILRFRFRNRSLSVIIPKDALSRNEYRILSARINRFS